MVLNDGDCVGGGILNSSEDAPAFLSGCVLSQRGPKTAIKPKRCCLSVVVNSADRNFVTFGLLLNSADRNTVAVGLLLNSANRNIEVTGLL